MTQSQKSEARLSARIYYQKHRMDPKVKTRMAVKWKSLRSDPRRYGEYLRKRRESYQNLRAQFITLYGGKCQCCGESRQDFLTLEHRNGDGFVDRRLRHMNTQRMYKEALAHPDPEHYELLCCNCQWGRYINGGICPHELSQQKK